MGADSPCWVHRAHLSPERVDPSTHSWVPLETLAPGALSSSMSSRSSRALSPLIMQLPMPQGGAQTQPPCPCSVTGGL